MVSPYPTRSAASVVTRITSTIRHCSISRAFHSWQRGVNGTSTTIRSTSLILTPVGISGPLSFAFPAERARQPSSRLLVIVERDLPPLLNMADALLEVVNRFRP